jgi:hypothetical protein
MTETIQTLARRLRKALPAGVEAGSAVLTDIMREHGRETAIAASIEAERIIKAEDEADFERRVRPSVAH